MATDRAGKNSVPSSDRSGSVSCGRSRGMTPMSATVCTAAKAAAVGIGSRLRASSSRVAAAMAMMKAKRCTGLSHSAPRITASVTTPMIVVCGLTWPMRSIRSSAWATRLEKLLS